MVTAEQTQADLREAAGACRGLARHVSPQTMYDNLTALADRLDALADTLPLRDTEQAVLDAAEKWWEMWDADVEDWDIANGALIAAVDAMRAARTGEGQ